jgi:hypothetical protein
MLAKLDRVSRLNDAHQQGFAPNSILVNTSLNEINHDARAMEVIEGKAMDWVDQIERDLVPVRVLQERLATALRMVEHLKGAVDEAGDKFWIGHLSTQDPGLKACMLRKSEEMHEAVRMHRPS